MRRYDALGQLRPETGFGVEHAADGGVLVFLGSQYADDSLLYGSNVVTMHVDPMGGPLDTNHLFIPLLSTYPGHANVGFLRPGGGYGIGGSSWDGTTGRPVLYLFDSAGVVEGMFQYGDSGQTWTGRQGKATPDGGYVICGETSSSGTSMDVFLLKIDSAFNQVWIHTYGQPDSNEYAVSVDLLPDGSYVVGGQQAISVASYDQWVLKIDSTGLLIWDERYGSAFNDGPNAHVTVTTDGNVVSPTAWATDNGGYLHQLGMFKVDAQGSLLWSHRYDSIAGPSALFVAKEIQPNGDLIAAGLSDRPGYLHGVLLRTNSLGDSLWMRYYHYEDSLITQGKGAFRDVVCIHDDGFIAVGAAFNSNNPNDPLVYSQDTWVVKVDSMGCLVPGCDGIGMITSQNTNYKGVLTLAPNPARSNVQVSWALPVARRSGAARLSVVSSSGAVVHTQEVDLSSSSVQLDVSNYQAGIYYVHLVHENDWVTGSKLVVE